MVIGVVYYYLIGKGLCCDFNIIVEMAGVCDFYYFVCLIGFGVIVVYFYFVFDVICDLVCIGEILMDLIDVQKNFCKVIDKGLFKIFLKMGILIVVFYCGV